VIGDLQVYVRTHLKRNSRPSGRDNAPQEEDEADIITCKTRDTDATCTDFLNLVTSCNRDKKSRSRICREKRVPRGQRADGLTDRMSKL
jgi:hypothetical protein